MGAVIMGRSKSSDEVTVTVRNTPSRSGSTYDKPVYEGITLLKRPCPLSVGTSSWLNAIETPMSRASIHKIVDRKRRGNGENVYQQYNALRYDSQRRRIDALLDYWRQKESGRYSWWNLYYIVDERAGVSKYSPETQTRALHVVLEKSYRPPMRAFEKVTDIWRSSRDSRSVRGGRLFSYGRRSASDHLRTKPEPQVIRYRVGRERPLRIVADKPTPLIEAPQPPDPTTDLAKRPEQAVQRYTGSIMDSKPIYEPGVFYPRAREEWDHSNPGSRPGSLYRSRSEYSRDPWIETATSRYRYGNQEPRYVGPRERRSFESSSYSDEATLDSESISLSSDSRVPSSSHPSYAGIESRGPTGQYSRHGQGWPNDLPEREYNLNRQRVYSSRPSRPDNYRQWSENSSRTAVAYETAPGQRRREVIIEMEEAHPRRSLRQRRASDEDIDKYMTPSFANMRIDPGKARFRRPISDDLLPPPPRGARPYDYDACYA